MNLIQQLRVQLFNLEKNGQHNYEEIKTILSTLKKNSTDEQMLYAVSETSAYNDRLYGMKYPFNEGDTYFTLEGITFKELMPLNSNGENPYIFKVVESCWDETSEEMHDENPNEPYFKTREDAEAVSQLCYRLRILQIEITKRKKK